MDTLAVRLTHRLLLALLCSAYLQGGLVKIGDLSAAAAEMARFGVKLPMLAASAAIVTELFAPVLVISGLGRRLGALWLAAFTLVATLIANRYWELPPGTPQRFLAASGLFEHLGLVAAFLLVALAHRWSFR